MDSSTPQAQPSGSFGNLTLLEELGAGEHGTVHRARVERALRGLAPGSEIAVKFLRNDLLGDENAAARFREEARIGKELRHPNVLRIYGLEERRWRGRPLVYLLMEFVEGRTLRQILEGGAAVETLVRVVGAQAAAGLASLHRARVIHRDIKPENLVLTSDGHCKLMDLGFATQRPLLRGRARSAGVHGSLAYLAPECLRGRPHQPEADIYALGVTLYELAAGRHPFACREEQLSADEMIRRILEDTPEQPSNYRPRLSPFADHVLLRMLETKAEQRPSAEELAQLWEQGEAARSWRASERRLPLLRSARRLRASRRPAHTPLFGRHRELAYLDQEFEAASEGRMRILHIHGPMGVGKRRLTDEWIQKQLDQRRTLRYYAAIAGERPEDARGNPIAGVLVEHYAGQARIDSFRALDRLSSRLVQLGGFEEKEAQDLAEALLTRSLGDERTFPAGLAAEALRRVGDSRWPLVLRIHRAERLDPATIRVLRFLAEKKAHVLILLTSNHEQRRPDFAELPVESLEIEQLSSDEAAAFVKALFRDPSEGSRVAAAIGRRIAPVPGLILETLIRLTEEGRLQGSEGEFHDARLSRRLPLSASVEQYLAAHWQQLSELQTRALGAAAVLGLIFDAHDVAALLGERELHVLEALSALRDSWVLASGARLRFKRTSQREAVLDFIGRDERVRLHGQAAALLSSRGADPLVTGLHWSRAAKHARAVPPLLDAARARFLSGELNRCRKLLRRTELHLRLLPRNPVHLRSWLKHKELAARLAAREGQLEKAQELIERALSLALPLKDAEESARLRLRLAHIAETRGFFSQAYALLQTAKTELASDQDGPEEAETLLLEATLLGELGFLRDGLSVAMQARLMLERIRQEHPVLHTQGTTLLARFEAARLRIDLADKHFAAGERAYRDLGLSHDMEWAQILRARFELEIGRGSKAEARLQQVQSQSQLPTHRLLSEVLLCRAALYQRHPQEAVSRYAALRDHALELKQPPIAVEAALYGLEARCELAPVPLAEAKNCLADAESLGLPRPVLLARSLAARCAHSEAEPEIALEYAESALRELREYSLEPTWILRFWLEKAEALRALGRVQEARRTRSLARHLLSTLSRRMPQRNERPAFLQATPVRRRLS
ncbi:MAG: hypothetical protein CSA62_04855 [Planctomycetota bacterium]|nr:MAG: hypothetical protein CSA62_04855 [Planctomycetota bacterium]